VADERVLTVNAGSSSLKLALFEAGPVPRRVFSVSVERLGSNGSSDAPGKTGAYARAFDDGIERLAPHGGLRGVVAVGHRIVHGGPRFEESTIITADVLGELRRIAILDPEHMPAAIALLEAATTRAPGLPQVACFDTAFHRSMPRPAQLLALPRRYEALGVRRYGFHGLSYEFLLSELERVAGRSVALGRVVFAHLGSGASLAAVHEGRSVDTTMGFTPNSGVPMGTRCGDLEPGVLLHLLRQREMTLEALDDMCSKGSGLLGVSETSADMRDLLSREAADPRAADAVALFCRQVRKAIGAMAATIGGVETLVFAGGIGERSPVVRERICAGLEHLGVELDADRNAAGSPVISRTSCRCQVRVIPTDEESVIARDALRLHAGAVHH
jgi:acetate kinase